MTQLPQLSELPVEPIYSQEFPSETIKLGTVDVSFEHDGQAFSETANATVRFNPGDRLTFEIPKVNAPLFDYYPLALDHWDGNLRLGDNGTSIQAMKGGIGKDNGGITLLPLVSGVEVTAPSDSIVSVIFHLFNFPDFDGPDQFLLRHGPETYALSGPFGRVILRSDDWVITLSAIRETKARVKNLRDEGGYGITHVGSIEREDRSPFTNSELSDVLTCLHYFLSFAIGRWAGVALPVGFDAQGNKVFEEWGLRRTASGTWKGSCSWFDERHGELLAQAFPGFRNLWKSELWKKPLADTIYWYCQANDRGSSIGVDTGLLLSQTALELLAWNYCVKDKRIVSEQAFKRQGLSAADKLKLLAFAVGVPTEIPPQLTALRNQPGRKWEDAMHAITGIRNSLVHPDSSLLIAEGSYYDAWRLSLWFIELTLLRLCDHSGKYANRLVPRMVGQVEKVPWAPVEQRLA